MSQASFWVDLLLPLGSSSGLLQQSHSYASVHKPQARLLPIACFPGGLRRTGVVAGTLLLSWCHLPEEYRPFC